SDSKRQGHAERSEKMGTGSAGGCACTHFFRTLSGIRSAIAHLIPECPQSPVWLSALSQASCRSWSLLGQSLMHAPQAHLLTPRELLAVQNTPQGASRLRAATVVAPVTPP